jgi:thymidylate synthase (FAD)
MKVSIASPSVELMAMTENAAALITKAGRVCYKSESHATNATAGEFVRKLMTAGHLSVIEHAVATLKFVTDRGVSHELVRHRIMSISQESTRYVNYDRRGLLQFVLPDDITDAAKDIMIAQAESAAAAYSQLVGAGVKAEVARDVLPTFTKTELVVTANFREWLHIIRLRTAKQAHPKIRRLITMAKKILVNKCPEVFDAELV